MTKKVLKKVKFVVCTIQSSAASFTLLLNFVPTLHVKVAPLRAVRTKKGTVEADLWQGVAYPGPVKFLEG